MKDGSVPVIPVVLSLYRCISAFGLKNLKYFESWSQLLPTVPQVKKGQAPPKAVCSLQA
jgi:hypothetical protein